MRQKRWIVVISLFYYISSFLHASEVPATPILNFRDSLLVEISGNNQKIIIHSIKKQQTLYSIAKFYGISYDEIVRINPKYKNANAQLGDKVKIPVPGRAIMKRMRKDFVRWKYAPVYYTAKEGETLFTIAKVYFKTPVDTLLKRNNLPKGSTTLHKGQLLQVGWFSTKGVDPSLVADTKADNEAENIKDSEMNLVKDAHPDSIFQKKFELLSKVTPPIAQQGAAIWQFNAKGSVENDFFILHSTAKKNSIIELTNPINRKKVYAKVVGKVPEGYQADIIAIVSKGVVKELGMRDPKFFVRLRYFN
ncbi:MAG: LysM peptidoglycan-binding domain-containing protein [Saprospiraceae bacterium]|nr:LysM peptidoglycan-binding domain-containing protein [Saprospiraceae bacterium]